MRILMHIIILTLTIFAVGCSMEKTNDSINDTFSPIPMDSSKYYDALSLKDIMELSGGTIDIIYFPDKNLPKEINGKFTTGMIRTPEDAVLALSSVRTIMCIDDISYACVKIEEYDEIKIFYLQQIYKDIMVLNGAFTVIATLEGEPVSISGFYINDIDLDTNPALSAGEAEKSFHLDKGTKIASSKLAVFKDNDEIVHLCWLFTISSRDLLKGKLIVIDANTGDYLIDYPFAFS